MRIYWPFMRVIIAREMTGELLEKIHKTLETGINEEKDLVYLLVETRKLIERKKYRDGIIKSYSDWIVHTKLLQRGGVTRCY